MPSTVGNDLRNVSSASKAILLNKDAIAISQDPLGCGAREPSLLVYELGFQLLIVSGVVAVNRRMGMRHREYNNYSATSVWSRPLVGGAVAVGCYNKGKVDPEDPNRATGPTGPPADIWFSFSSVGLPGSGPFIVRDVWRGLDHTVNAPTYTAKGVAHHGTTLLHVSLP